jgi:molybdenum cofactor biosynthesis protein B
MTAEEHKQKAPKSVKCSILTVSSSRTKETDVSGDIIEQLLSSSCHKVESRQLVEDNTKAIRNAVDDFCEKEGDVLIITGGTGISEKDLTLGAVKPLLSAELEGFGELFRWMSFKEIGPSVILSRAFAGTIKVNNKNKLIFAIPGSPNACRLACEKIIIPELGHMVWEANRK